ncbi:hypothetical protein [Siminovitchia terrae]|uniref:hypothetical protein n=1 Tax=Siminovitchia terrae TaxID=1914933 RepID=UPI0028A91B75|nr:hypothetical protein [Siminovitchia terrae]
MQITINQITPRRENNGVTSVQVHFTARTPDGNINLSGNIPVAEFTNSIDFGVLETAVKQELINRIMNGESPTE